MDWIVLKVFRPKDEPFLHVYHAIFPPISPPQLPTDLGERSRWAAGTGKAGFWPSPPGHSIRKKSGHTREGQV